MTGSGWENEVSYCALDSARCLMGCSSKAINPVSSLFPHLQRLVVSYCALDLAGVLWVFHLSLSILCPLSFLTYSD